MCGLQACNKFPILLTKNTQKSPTDMCETFMLETSVGQARVLRWSSCGNSFPVFYFPTCFQGLHHIGCGLCHRRKRIYTMDIIQHSSLVDVKSHTRYMSPNHNALFQAFHETPRRSYPCSDRCQIMMILIPISIRDDHAIFSANPFSNPPIHTVFTNYVLFHHLPCCLRIELRIAGASSGLL